MAIDVRSFRWNNLARSVLAELIGPATTEFDVVDGSLFPTTDKPGDFSIECDRIIPLIVWDEAEEQLEIMYATARDGNTFTVERGKEGTTAGNFSAGAHIINAATAGFFEQQVAVTTVATAPVLSGELNVDGTTYDLSWTASTVDADDSLLAYDIYRDDGDGYGFALIDTVGPLVLSYNDATADVNSGLTYTYYVQPRSCVGGAGTVSNQVVTLITLWIYAGNTGDEISYSIDGAYFNLLSSGQNNGYGWGETGIIGRAAYSSEQNMWMAGSYGAAYTHIYTSETGLRWRGRQVTGKVATADMKVAPLYLHTDYGFGDPVQGRWVIMFEDNNLGSVYYSDDSGVTWTQASVGDDTSTNARSNMLDMAFAPTLGTSGRIVAVGATADAAVRCWYSDDGGANWNIVNENFNATVADSVTWDPVNQKFVVVAGAHAAYSSDGITWTVLTSVFGSSSPRGAWWDENRSRVYAHFTNEYVYYTADGGANWTELTTGVAGAFIASAYDPIADKIMLVGGDNTQARASYDGWATQEADYYPGIFDKGTVEGWLSLGRTPSPVRQSVLIAIGDADPIGQRNGSWLRSWDGGDSWFPFDAPEPLLDWRQIIYLDDIGRFVALNADGTNRIYYSDDDGETWTGVNTFPTHAAFDSMDYANGYIVACRHAAATNSTYYSADHGLTWTQVDHSAVYTNFEPHTTIYVPWGGGAWIIWGSAGGSNNGIYTQDWSTWAAATSSGPSGTCHGAVYDASRDQVIVALEIVNSKWRQTSLGGALSNYAAVGAGAGSTTSPSQMHYLADEDIYVYFGTQAGISTDGALNWFTGDGVGTPWHSTVVEFSDGTKRLVAVSSGTDLYVSDDPVGSNFETRTSNIANTTMKGVAWNGVPFTPTINNATSWEWDFAASIEGPPSYIKLEQSTVEEGEYTTGSTSYRVAAGLLIDNLTNSATVPHKFSGTKNLKLSLDMSNVGFSVTLFSNSGQAVSSTTACAFGLLDATGAGGCADGASIAVFVDAVATTGGFASPNIGYRASASSQAGLTAFTNASGPYTLTGTEDDPDIEHTFAFGINGTTAYVYWDGRLLDSFTVTAGEIAAIGSPHTVQWGAFAGDTLGTYWGELRKIEVGDFTVAN